MVPPVGAIIIGPCPECKELVVVFCGHVLALEKDTMEQASIEGRRDHLLSVLTEFLQERISKLLNEANTVEEEGMGENFQKPSDQADESPDYQPEDTRTGERGPISQTEFDRFTEVDLKLLDNKAYFKSVFDNA